MRPKRATAKHILPRHCPGAACDNRPPSSHEMGDRQRGPARPQVLWQATSPCTPACPRSRTPSSARVLTLLLVLCNPIRVRQGRGTLIGHSASMCRRVSSLAAGAGRARAGREGHLGLPRTHRRVTTRDTVRHQRLRSSSGGHGDGHDVERHGGVRGKGLVVRQPTTQRLTPGAHAAGKKSPA